MPNAKLEIELVVCKLFEVKSSKSDYHLCILNRFSDTILLFIFSPSLIALSSKDPILTAFELSWELRRLSFAEHEFKSEYLVSFRPRNI